MQIVAANAIVCQMEQNTNCSRFLWYVTNRCAKVLRRLFRASQPAFVVRIMKFFWNRWVYPYRSVPFFLWFLNICMPLWCHDYFFRIRYYRVSAIGILFAPLLGVHFSFGKINTAQSNKRTHLINNYTFYALIFLCGWIGVAVYVAIKELASALFVLNDFMLIFHHKRK